MTLSIWTHLICGVPQQSVLGLLPFNIYSNDLNVLFFLTRHKHDTTASTCDETFESVLNKFCKETHILQSFALKRTK